MQDLYHQQYVDCVPVSGYTKQSLRRLKGDVLARPGFRFFGFPKLDTLNPKPLNPTPPNLKP